MPGMKCHSEEHFLEWAAGQGIRIDSRWLPHSKCLQFDPDSDLGRFWVWPDASSRLPQFLESMLRLLEPWRSCFVWSPRGWLPASRDPKHPQGRATHRVYCQILAGAEVPVRGPDSLELEAGELDKLLTVLFANCVFEGGASGNDLYVVPNTARCILKTDHHGVVHVRFRTQEDLEAYIRGMREAGHPLPTELPDATFKPQGWMNGSATDG